MSERIEERLRMAAQTYRKLGNYTAEGMFLEAADTIWQLRDDLQRTNDAVQDAEHDESMAWDRVRKAEAEADKLREERDMYRDLVGMMDHPDLNAQLQAENAKLRELVRDMYRCLDPCNDCSHYNDSNDGFYCDLGVGWKAKRMRELGVEVEQ